MVKANNLSLTTANCEFGKNRLTFLSHVISAQEIEPAPEKVLAIKTCQAPKNDAELQSFLGLISYVGARSIRNSTELTQGLRSLVHKGAVFKLDNEKQREFEKLKEAAANIDTLGFFDPLKTTKLFADAGPTSLGAVVGGDSQVVAYASKTISPVQQRA